MVTTKDDESSKFGRLTNLKTQTPHVLGNISPNFMNLDNVDCLTKSPMSPEDREHFESPLKNERILRLSESNGSTGKMSANFMGRVLKKRS